MTEMALARADWEAQTSVPHWRGVNAEIGTWAVHAGAPYPVARKKFDGIKPIRILIVDDHAMFRSGIKLALQRHDGFEVVGEAGGGLEGIKRAKQLKPDVLLLDLHMPGTGGLEALRMLAEEVPETQVVMLTVSEDTEDLLDTLRAGARGYLLKNIDTEFLVKSVQLAARGESVMSPQITHKLADFLRTAPKNNFVVGQALPA